MAARISAGGLFLHQARHPLLERILRARGGQVVPISLEMDAPSAPGAPNASSAGESSPVSRRQLIITGPNTGGKTLALKTIGLLVLMAQSGMPVPADRAELPICDAVLADIGDYQSIEQNLSTFSAHVTNIDRISRTATAQSLVLLDELGSATDPEEGAALAVAIADHFRQVGALTVISTHHTSLKVYAINTPGVVNAAVGFDERTLQPTYELHVGVPGASAGINIAQRLGLNPEIVAAARTRLGAQAQEWLHVSRPPARRAAGGGAAEGRSGQAQQELEVERNRLSAEGRREQREKTREMERKLESLLRDFEFHAREAVTAIQDRGGGLEAFEGRRAAHRQAAPRIQGAVQPDGGGAHAPAPTGATGRRSRMW